MNVKGKDVRKVKLPHDTRERIIRGAMKVFSQQGFFKTPVHLIAVKSGVSKGLIFWYFSSKDELILEVAKRSLPLDIIRRCLKDEIEGRKLLECIGRRYLDKYERGEMRHLLIHTIAVEALYPEIRKDIRELCENLLRKAARRAFGDESQESMIRIRGFFGALLCYVLRPLSRMSNKEYLSETISFVWDREPCETSRSA